MDLASVVNDLAIDYSYLAGGMVAVNAMIYNIYKKEPLYLQQKPKSKVVVDGLNDKGSRFMIDTTLRLAGKTGIITLTAYGIDYLFGIDNNAINLHHIFCYGGGSLLYLSALSNYIDFRIRRRSVEK